MICSIIEALECIGDHITVQSCYKPTLVHLDQMIYLQYENSVLSIYTSFKSIIYQLLKTFIMVAVNLASIQNNAKNPEK